MSLARVRCGETNSIGFNINVPHGLVDHTGSWITFAKPPPTLPMYAMPQQQHEIEPSIEC
jgi:hypothetical protein